MCKIHNESNSRDEFCQKLGEIYRDRYDGLNPMPPVTVNSQFKTETGQLTSPTVSQVHGYPGHFPGYLQCQTNAMVLSKYHLCKLIHLLTDKIWLILLQLNQILPEMQDQITQVPTKMALQTNVMVSETFIGTWSFIFSFSAHQNRAPMVPV